MRYYIVWNPTRTEGFITNDAGDAEYARTGFQEEMAVSTAGQAFRDAYCEEDDDSTELPMTELNVPDGVTFMGWDLAAPEKAGGK